MPLPNWPGKLPDDAPAIQNPNPTGDPAFVVNTVLHSTIQEARAAGAVEGTMLAAPLAPSKGPIDAPPESMVVVTVKNFFDTPTWKAIRTVLQATGAALFIAFASAILPVWAAGKSIFDAGAVDWRVVELTCEIAAGPVLMSGLMALLKKKDNNPTT
jgi:hypothetical protein